MKIWTLKLEREQEGHFRNFIGPSIEGPGPVEVVEKAEYDRLCEALEFYADGQHLMRKSEHPNVVRFFQHGLVETGWRARLALKQGDVSAKCAYCGLDINGPGNIAGWKDAADDHHKKCAASIREDLIK